ncbi:TPA: hypothetical protein ACH3X3_002013 [Trebouxia sp. C0006]
MRTLFCCVCLALCLSCSEALAPNQGTGKNCNTASDAPGGPKCTGSQIGVCCGASVDSDNCLRVLGATAANTDNKPPAGSLPSCATLLGPNRYRHSAATKWMRQGDSNVICCAHGGTDCVIPWNTDVLGIGQTTTAASARSRDTLDCVWANTCCPRV